ncbi:MAG: GxxExxY protein [Planctomycetes bacterium]|nr:GxxExxY protein [Planctomycetota bacterium]
MVYSLSNINELTERVIGCAFKVSNTLGPGFLEKVYENALVIELRKAGLKVAQQVPYNVLYEGQVAGLYVADVVVEDLVLLELKAIKELDSSHTSICLNYLNASKLTLCLLMNFAKPKLDVRRLAL